MILRVLEEDDHRGKIPFHRMQLRVHTVNVTYHIDNDLHHLPGVVFVVMFLHCKVTLPLQYCALGKEVILHSPHLRNEELYSLSVYWEFFSEGNLSLLSHLLTYLIIYIHKTSLTFIICVIIQYFFLLLLKIVPVFGH